MQCLLIWQCHMPIENTIEPPTSILRTFVSPRSIKHNRKVTKDRYFTVYYKFISTLIRISEYRKIINMINKTKSFENNA